MNISIRELCDMTSLALQNTQYLKVLTYPETVFTTAHENGLSGLVYRSIPKGSLNETINQKFMTDWLRYQARDIAQRAAIEEIDRACDEAGLDHLYLKGAILKDCYPESYMRSMGDIDVLFRAEDMEKVHVLFENQLGYHSYENSETHDVFMKDRDLIVEAHRSIDVECHEQRWTLFAYPWKHAILEHKNRYEFEPEYFLMHLLRHLSQHILRSGIGLRSIIDIGLFLEKNIDHIDKKKLDDMLISTAYNQFFYNVVELNYFLFKIDTIDVWRSKGNLDLSLIEDLVEYISSSGVHGTAKGFNKQAVGMTTTTLKKRNASVGRLSYIINVIFPSRKALQSHYRYLYHYAWLLPIAWIDRWWKKVFRQSKQTVRQIRNLSVKNSTIDARATLFKKLGL